MTREEVVYSSGMVNELWRSTEDLRSALKVISTALTDAEEDRDQLIDALRKIEHFADLTSPDVRLNALVRISEIVNAALQEAEG